MKAVPVVMVLLTVLTFAPIASADDSSELTHEDLLDLIRQLEARIESLETTVQALQAEVADLRRQPDTESAERESEETDSPGAEPTTSESTSEWKGFARGWEYRNPTFRDIGFGSYQFVVEVKRTGDSVDMAMFTVTLYDDSGGIAATGSGFAMDMLRGDSKTVQFLLQGDPSSASTFRLQVDSEI